MRKRKIFKFLFLIFVLFFFCVLDSDNEKSEY